MAQPMTDEEFDALSDYALFKHLASVKITAAHIASAKKRGDLFASDQKSDLDLRCIEFYELLHPLLYYRPLILKSTFWSAFISLFREWGLDGDTIKQNKEGWALKALMIHIINKAKMLKSGSKTNAQIIQLAKAYQAGKERTASLGEIVGKHKAEMKRKSPQKLTVRVGADNVSKPSPGHLCLHVCVNTFTCVINVASTNI
jgi:hypothetical protein